MNKVIVVVGPTGVGKTKMGVELAKVFDGEIISGDSMQIYKQMDIGTAKVTKEETQGITHHLVDIKDPTDSYSVKEFQETVRKKIQEILSKGKTPILVGGTGLYIKATLYDYEFSETQDNHEDIKEKYAHLDNHQLYNYLMSIDQSSALELHENNRQRVLRAIGIYEQTGQRKSEQLAKQKHECIYDAYFVGLTIDRELLYERINQRVDVMKNLGLEKEVCSLYKNGLTRAHQSMKAIGYKEWFDYFEGLCSLDDVYENIKKHSRQYAKRQYTWFKNQFDMHWYEVDLTCFDKTVTKIVEDIKNEK
ncbi:MAG: tRNA (adenosine(37)-N6)-dimethylallyltransferase MiaA [Erysipelotrichales bacterium]|nr:tRNA (adenosine(37)-N6)-dimethylallyltransferase MiaA [Erysipelotrichales bacterium]